MGVLKREFAAEKQSRQNREEAAMAHSSLLITEALSVAHNAPDVREDRVEAIRAQLAEGAYEIDIKQLAENLIRENPGLFDQ